jgi:hypothetical protein
MADKTETIPAAVFKEMGPAHMPNERATQRPGLERATTSSSATSIRAGTGTLPSCRIPQYNQHGHPVHGLYRIFTSPTEEIDVAEALKLPPQPNTFRYQLQQLRENGGEKKTRVTTDEDKKAEFERVKNALKAWNGR